MGIFDWLKTPDIHKGVEEYRNTPGALLLDVRTGAEYAEGHIPGSVNIPMQFLDEPVAEDTDTPIFVYCLSGGRSRQAAAMLRREGYTKVKDIGGIAAYTGEVEK